jgi:hypothetical protein
MRMCLRAIGGGWSLFMEGATKSGLPQLGLVDQAGVFGG